MRQVKTTKYDTCATTVYREHGLGIRTTVYREHGLGIRLRVVSNFGDSGEIHARARKWASAKRSCSFFELRCSFVELSCSFVELSCSCVELSCSFIELSSFVELRCSCVELSCSFVELSCSCVDLKKNTLVARVSGVGIAGRVLFRPDICFVPFLFAYNLTHLAVTRMVILNNLTRLRTVPGPAWLVGVIPSFFRCSFLSLIHLLSHIRTSVIKRVNRGPIGMATPLVRLDHFRSLI